MNYDLLFLVGGAIFVALNVFDVLSTFRAIKNGNAYEANPLMAWFQAKLGHLWWVAKLPLSLILVALWIKARGLPAVTGVWIACALYGVVVWNNYRLAAK